MLAAERSAQTAPATGALAFRLPEIPYLRLAVRLRAEAPASLPAYQGSMLRGAFGQALRRLVCVMPRGQECDGCRLRGVCTYTRLFETFIEGEPPPFLRGLPTSPRPYLIEPRCDLRHLAAGEPLDFDLVLIGQAIALHTFAALAIERMAEAGLGSARHRFRMERIAWQQADGSWRPLTAAASPSPGGGGLSAEPPAASLPRCDLPDTGRARLRFLTPARLKVRDHLVDTIGFRPLVFAMLRRILELAHLHVPGEPVDWSFRPLLEAADGVRVTTSDLRWYDWERYSNRQRQKMKLGGFIGEMQIEGELGPLASLLRAAEVFHVGKGATFGLGKIEIA